MMMMMRRMMMMMIIIIIIISRGLLISPSSPDWFAALFIFVIIGKRQTRTLSTNLTQNDCILVEASSTQTESQSELQILLKNSFSTQAVDKLDTPLQKRAPKTGWNPLLL